MQSRPIKHYIEHIIEPAKLLMTWQDNRERTHYTVAELTKVNEQVTLRYLVDTPDFHKARQSGFGCYPAFPNVNEPHHIGVLDSLMRRLPPRTRADFPQYLENFRIHPDVVISDFALLGYTGAKLPSDGFGIINPFFNIASRFEFLLEAAGYRHIENINIELGNKATFGDEFDPSRQEEMIKIFVAQQHIGYVTRALISPFLNWMTSNRVGDAWVEKKNGSLNQPTMYLYVKIS